MDQDVSKPEIAGFAAWCGAVFALSLIASIVIEHRVVELHRSSHLSNHFLAAWAATWGGSILLLTVLAGVLLFRQATAWQVILTWPWLVGPVVGLAWFLAFTGQMDGGSKLCEAPANGSCDTAWGLGAIFLSIGAALVLGGTFVAAATMTRVVRLRWGGARTGR